MKAGDMVQLTFNAEEESYGLVLREIPSGHEDDQAFEVLYKNNLCKLETDGVDWWWEEDYDIPINSILHIVQCEVLQKNNEKNKKNLM